MTVTVLFVGLGGFIGTVGRYLVGVWLAPAAEQRFPLSTFAVNVFGCALIGLVAGLAAERSGGPPWLTADLRAFLMVGILGGFTTFSAFGNETFRLLQRGDALVAVGYVGASIVVGLAAVWLGYRFAAVLA